MQNIFLQKLFLLQVLLPIEISHEFIQSGFLSKANLQRHYLINFLLTSAETRSESQWKVIDFIQSKTQDFH